MSRVRLFTNISELMTGKGVVKKKGRRIKEKDLSIIRDGAFVTENGRIIWVGKRKQIPEGYLKEKTIDVGGLNVFPGFVDCHTHMVFAGDRQNEFEMRNQGISYQQIAKKGGGILSTMRATRKSSAEELVELAQERVDRHLAQGVTCVEIKSGYGLNKKTELKMLEVAKALRGPKVIPTYLGAHAIPKEFKNEKSYLESLKKDLLEVKNKRLSERVDIFIEKGYFTTKASRDYLEFAKSHGFDLTIHADQLSRTGASMLGVDLGAQSLDHVICLTGRDRKKLSQSETVAVLLPSADFYLECDYPNARDLIDQGAVVALATDFNPGSSPSQNIQLVGLLARLKMKMTLPEVFAALTYGGAKALNLHNSMGALLPDYRADFFVSQKSWRQFFYDLGEEPVRKTYVRAVLKCLN